MERALYISKYRNIGFEKDERIVLNNSLEKGKIGNLVILVGANNSGKSNLLAALKSFKVGKITERDLTTLSYDEVHQKPMLSLCSKDGDKEFYYRIGYQTSPSYGYPKNLHLDFNYVENLNLFKDLINKLIDRIGYGYNNAKFMQLFNDTIKSLSKPNLNNNEIYEIIEKCFTWDFSYNVRAEDILNDILEYDDFISIKEVILNNFSCEPSEKINLEYKKLYGMNFLPNIINYE